MKNKGAIIFLSVAITALCLFSLSFTYMANTIDNEIAAYAEGKVADAKAANENINLDSLRKSETRAYRDSIWKKEVYLGYTFKEVKAWSLNLGLDLQGGVHATVIVSPVEIIKSMSDNSEDPAFLAAIEAAKVKQRNSQEKFTAIFLSEFQATQGKGKLAEIFVNVDNKFAINPNSTDEEIIDIINVELDDAIDRSLIVLRSRIDRFGTTSPIIQAVKSTGRIEVELPGADDEETIARQITEVAKLEFLEVWTGAEFDPYFTKINEYLVSKGEIEDNEEANTEVAPEESSELYADGEAEEDTLSEEAVEEEDEALFATEEGAAADSADKGKDTTALAQEEVLKKYPILNYIQVDPRSGTIFARAQDYEKVEALFNSKEVKSILPDDLTMVWGDRSDINSETGGVVVLYPVKKGDFVEAALGGQFITNAYQSFDGGGRPAVSMEMNVEGAKRWKRLTEANIGRSIAVALDNVVFSAPNVNEAITGGQSIISGNFDIEEAKTLARILKAGKLPAPTTIERMVVVGPSLGQAAIDRGLISLIAGLALVIAFMVFYYSKGGLVADIALLFNIFFILGLLAQKGVGAALTLPGIAGIVLTIGMSIDANVLVFERIREELTAGKPLKISIDNGYKRAFWSIFDSNITTLMTAVILGYFGSGLIKGFAVTLGIGIVSSFFSAVFITRLIIEAMVKGKDDNSVSFSTSLSKGILKNKSFDFIGKRKIAYAFSGVVIAIGIVLIVTQGLNLGVAFKGGHSYIVQFDGDVNPTEVKSKLTSVFVDASTEVKSFDGAKQVQVTTSYMINSEEVNSDEIVKGTLLKGLESYNELNPEVVQSIVVGPTIADDIKSTSLKSIIIALVAIFFYIIIRFRKVGFGIGAFIALLHDVLFVLSIFSIVRLAGVSFEIDEVFVAAILTLVGYSINDTVVVFDHVREHMAGRTNLNKEELGGVLNKALNGTLSRTMMTSVTTLLVITVLLIFGGEALRGFSFALLIGVMVGTYSSVFIATPVVLDTTSNGKEDKE